jgi:hypothetical protein
MQELINEAKRTTIEEKNMEREFLYGSQRSGSRSYEDYMECDLIADSVQFCNSESKSSVERAFKSVLPGRRNVGSLHSSLTSFSASTPPPPSSSAVPSAPRNDMIDLHLSAPTTQPSTSHSTKGTSTMTSENSQQRNADRVSSSAGSAVALDYTEIPTLLDQKYEKFDLNNSLRPTIINVGKAWEKKSQTTLLSSPTTTLLTTDDQTTEKNAAFDLIDALTRSGAMVLEHASLHVVIAATHNFDQNLMDTVVQKNMNPIERVEHSSLIIASTLHGMPPQELLSDKQLDRVLTYSPGLFIEE